MIPRRSRRTPNRAFGGVQRHCRAFTLVEVMVASAMTAVLLVAVLFSIVTILHTYAASEQYGAGQADQARLLDWLALDLRRGLQVNGQATPYSVDPDGQGLKISVPDYYCSNATDPQHLYPMPVRPTYDRTAEIAYYNGSGAAVAPGATPYLVIAYRFNAADGSITRFDPSLPLVSNGSGGFVAAAPAVIATHMTAFPTLSPDPSDITGNIVRYSVSFHSTFLLLSGPSDGTTITLHNVTFIRSKNLAL